MREKERKTELANRDGRINFSDDEWWLLLYMY